MSNDTLWKTKLAARIHDPAEKALVLLRDPEGHENGTSRVLKRLLGLNQPSGDIDPDNAEALSTVIFKKGLPLDIYRHVQRADWWAAAADRPQWPMQQITVTTKKGEKKTLWDTSSARVNWSQKPVLIHPLTGEKFDLSEQGGLSETDFRDIKQRSFKHFSALLKELEAQDNEAPDFRKILLAYWRFGPDLSATEADPEDFGKLGALWEVLPADTRVPDHSIWDHLDLTSAFAGAFAADPNGEAALLALSIGPVQSFIAAARKMDDLWAGSHLLSRLAWEAMRPLCEEFGPDAILFPRLRGIPQVDLWLCEMGLPKELFAHCEWMQGSTDANPLFSAALPNRFVAVVPASQAREMANKATAAVRGWLLQVGKDVVKRLLEAADLDVNAATPYEQMKQQLAGFPEVHWAAVPFSLIRARNTAKQTDLDTSALSTAMAPFFGVTEGEDCGFLASPAWQLLKDGLQFTDDSGKTISFFAPNPGVLYPAVYDLAERVLAAAKATRTFEQSKQRGWRCSLTGEAEWLTTDRSQLACPPGSRSDTLWTRIAAKNKAWAKEGEHLSALPAIKRLWPTIFADEVRKATGASISRFVVSTHTMALAHQLDTWLEKGGETISGLETNGAEPVALPRGLVRRHKNKPALEVAKRLPALLETDDEAAYEKARRQIEQAFAAAFGQDKDEIRLETYYALLMMDGDRMGAILSGDEKTAISYRASFHPDVQKGFDQLAQGVPRIEQYGKQKRALSPNRHLAISGALNDFSQTVVRHVVEVEHLGRVIYAGGDDVLAMLPVADLLSCMQRLRHAYSGHDPEHAGGVLPGLTLHKGYAALKLKDGLRVMRMMGTTATASCGAVIAHHQAPLSAVLRELREAEKRAKSDGGRDAFSITVIKRSGGALRLVAKWGEPIALLHDLRAFLADPDVSRRAVYNTLEWLKEQLLPARDEDSAMLQTLLTYQLCRQTNKKDAETKDKVAALAKSLTEQTLAQDEKRRIEWLRNFLSIAEFLARETRTGGDA